MPLIFLENYVTFGRSDHCSTTWRHSCIETFNLMLSIYFRYYLIFVFIGKAPKKATSKFTAKNYNVHVQGKDAYVAAYLQKLPQDGIFIIGDSTTTEKKDASKRKRRSTTSFANSPLEPSREYSWFQRGCVSGVCILLSLKHLVHRPFTIPRALALI